MHAPMACPAHAFAAVMDDNRLPALWGRASAETLASLTGAHLTTARRWKRLPTLPRWLAVLVRTVLEGELADLSAAWAGWRIVGGELVSPEGWHFGQGEIRALPFLRAQLRALQVRERLPGQSDWITGRTEPLPGALVQDAAPRPGAAVADLADAARSPPQQRPGEHAGRDQQQRRL